MLDPSLQQNLNKYEKDLPLGMRLFNPNNADRNNQLKKLFEKENTDFNKQSGKVKGKRDRNEAQNADGEELKLQEFQSDDVIVKRKTSDLFNKMLGY